MSLPQSPNCSGRVTRLTNSKGLLTKAYALTDDGQVHKQTRAQLFEGTAEEIPVAGLKNFVEVLKNLRHDQALTYGITGLASARLVTKDRLHEHPGAISRTRNYFTFSNGPAILMLDHDADHTTAPFDAESLRTAVLSACPELCAAPMLWTASASSCITNSETGEVFSGLRGQRLYVLVANGSDIPRAGAALYSRLWLAGFGRFIVSQNGSMLDRNIIDGSVFQPERIDFAAGAKCAEPLVQSRSTPITWNETSPPFDSRLITELTADELDAVHSAKQVARNAVADEARKIRDEYISREGKVLADARGLEIDEAMRIITEAVEGWALFAEFLLHPQDADPVTVGEVLDDPARWHGKRFADPIEPNYRSDKRVAYANLRSGGRPFLYSHAHGGRRFELLRQPTRLKIQPGEEPRLTDEVLRVFKSHGELFDFGRGLLVRVADGHLLPVTSKWLEDYAGRHIRFVKFDARSRDWRPARTPDWLPHYIIGRIGERDLPRLNAVITAPTLRADGSVLDAPGFDAESGLLFLSDDHEPPRVPPAPNLKQVRAAFQELWEPFAEFPFTDDTARGVMLASLLTAVVRRAIPTAPGFAFDAPAAGSGKTLLASCVAVLGGHPPHMTAPPRDEDEARKALFAAAREGVGAIIWDNVTRPLDGAALNAWLTADTIADRILGQSETSAVPNRAMFITTGNNIRIVGDTCRRMLVCRIDARSETPYLRSFKYDPLQWVRDRRQRLVRAALTILRGYQVAGSPLGEGRMASFEVWNDLVRQAVVWLGQTVGGFADPALSALRNAAQDPVKGTLATVLSAWRGVFGNRPVTAGEVWAKAFEEFSDGASALRAAIEDIAEGDKNFNARRLGLWLAKHKGEIAHALFFEDSVDSHAKVKRWSAEHAG